MKLPIVNIRIRLVDFSPLDEHIRKMRELRDSYHSANRELYGDSLAALLNN